MLLIVHQCFLMTLSRKIIIFKLTLHITNMFFYFNYSYCLNTYLESALRWRCSLRYHSNLLFLGTKSETARASSCQPWTNTNVGGLVLQSNRGGAGGGVACRDVGEPLWVPPAPPPPPPFPDEDEESQANKDWVAHSSSCWKHKFTTSSYYSSTAGALSLHTIHPQSFSGF